MWLKVAWSAGISGRGGGDARKVKGRVFLLSISKSINATYLIDEASFQKYFCVRTLKGQKISFVPYGIPIGFEMAEKKLRNRQTNRQTDKQTDTRFRIYNSRDFFPVKQALL